MSEEKKGKDTDKMTDDKASREALEHARDNQVSTAWDRYEQQQPQCNFGTEGICCRICNMGPCRIIPGRQEEGVCGADAATIVARNFVRMIAGGSSAHSDHGRGVAHTFLEAAKGEAPGYEIKDEEKLMEVAERFGIEVEDRDVNEIAVELGEKAMSNFSRQEGELDLISLAPEKRQDLWRRNGVVPRGIDREVVESMHRSTMGVDQDYKNIIKQGTRAALADGWGGSMIATELQDILFGTPGQPGKGGNKEAVAFDSNLGVLKEDEVNIVVHGHEPLISEMIAIAAQEDEILEYAEEKGAKGVNISGICCTANELLQRHGIPVAGNFLQQELAISTGAVDMMMVDVQCIMQSLERMLPDYHTKIVTTTDKARMPMAEHIEFDESQPLESARKILREAIDNYSNREGVTIPEESEKGLAGFSHEYIKYMLGGSYRSSYWPLNSNIKDGKIRGVAGVVGCNNAAMPLDKMHVPLVEELIANNVLVVQTGCAAIASAKAGLMQPETALEKAGDGLAEVCEAVGIPPVLHAGACVDNSRILNAVSEMVKVGQENSRLNIGDDISELPVAGAAPEWMSEKAIAIGHYFVTSGVYTVFGGDFPTTGSEVFSEYLFDGLEEIYGATWDTAEDPSEMAGKIIDHIDKKREELGIGEGAERVLYDMEMRREMID